MKRAALLLLAACSAPADFDAGVRFCVTSSCDLAGTWQATYRVADGGFAGRCIPHHDPLWLQSRGGQLCMERAESGSASAGCAFSFGVRRSGFDLVGSEVWEFHPADAGVLEGTLSVTQQFPECAADFTFTAVR